MTPLLEVETLTVGLARRDRRIDLVDGVTLSVDAGESVGLVGESGSGKSITAFAIAGLFPAPGIAIAGGDIRLDGVSLPALAPPARRRLIGRRIGMVFQDPSAYLDPLLPVGRQIAEVLVAHGRHADRRARVEALLATVDLPDPAGIARRYPHELSGGQRQRVLIAAALALDPALLIADEPTTALDVTVQAGILDLLGRLRRDNGLGILLVTHDLGVVAQHCARIAVMYAGRIVETGTTDAIFRAPRHPYTQGLLRSTLTAEGQDDALFSIPGRVPAADAPPPGCRFHPRCPIARADPCLAASPPLRPHDGGADACWRSDAPEAADAWRVVA